MFKENKVQFILFVINFSCEKQKIQMVILTQDKNLFHSYENQIYSLED